MKKEDINKKIKKHEADLIVVNEHLEHIETQVNNFINLSSFKNDNNTYDEALNLCINYAITNKMKKIILPPKQITLSSNHILENNILYWEMIFEGSGVGVDGRGTEIKFTGTGCMLKIDLTLPSAGSWRGIHFKNISFTGNGSNDLLLLIFNQQTTFENCSFSSCRNAVITTGNTHYSKFYNCKFTTCENGVFSPNSTSEYYVSGEANNHNIDNCFFTYCTTPLNQQVGNGWLVNNTDFEGYNGTIKLNSSNRFVNVRLERNKQGIYIEMYSNNHIECNVHGSGGGIACDPCFYFKGNNNICYISGNGYRVADSDPNTYNKIIIKSWTVLESQIMLNKISNTNKFESFDYPLANFTLNDFIKSNFTYDNVSGQIVKSSDGYMYYNYTPSTDTIYITLKQKVNAGGGFRIECNGKSFDIPTIFPTIDTNYISIYQFKVNKGVANEIKITCSGGNGSTITIKDFKVSDYISNYLFN